MKTSLTSKEITYGAHRSISCQYRSNLDLSLRLRANWSQHGHKARPNGTAVVMLCPGIWPQIEAILPSEHNFLAVFHQFRGHKRASTSTRTKDTPCRPKYTLIGLNTQLMEKFTQNVSIKKELYQQKATLDLPCFQDQSIKSSIQWKLHRFEKRHQKFNKILLNLIYYLI